MQGKTKADDEFFDMPMQSPLFKGGSLLQPKLVILKMASLSQIHVPFEYLPPSATTSGSFNSTENTYFLD